MIGAAFLLAVGIVGAVQVEQNVVASAGLAQTEPLALLQVGPRVRWPAGSRCGVDRFRERVATASRPTPVGAADPLSSDRAQCRVSP